LAAASSLRKYRPADVSAPAQPPRERWGGLAGIDRKQQSWPIRIATVEETEREIEATVKQGGHFVALCEPEYPMLLRRTSSASPLIAVRGNVLALQRSKIAIIGARNASAAGLALAAQLARAIGRAGHVIVSGLARGIDARAHQTAIETGTIAVVAGGLGNI
jgi:DNA processing protein